MCIGIAHFSDAEDLDWDTFKRLRKRHGDGHSIMWIEDGKIRTWKSLSRLDLMYYKYLMLREDDKDMVIHFRRATKGKVCLENCHPFFVHKDLAFVHNGTIDIPDLPDGKSDTLEFRDRILRILPDNWYENSDLRDMVNSYTGWSRFIFLNSKGKMYIINENKGYWDNGTWFSNGTYKEYQKTNKTYNKGWWNRGSKKSDEDDDDIIDLSQDEQWLAFRKGKKASGYFCKGDPICDYCLPMGDEKRDDVYDINLYYDNVEGAELYDCAYCGEVIWPYDSIVVDPYDEAEAG